jgi:hypothetical protein
VLQIILYTPLFSYSNVWFDELLQLLCCYEHYAYVGLFKHIGNFFYLWTVLRERGPEFPIFLFGLCVASFVLYVSEVFGVGVAENYCFGY